MKDRVLETLRDEYPTSSWAIWSSSFPDPGCVEEDPSALYELIRRNRDRLRPSIVLLSLNPSTELPSNYQNFHSTAPKHRNDQFRDLVEDAGLEGAYMTDLVERTVSADSGVVSPNDADIENLFEQLVLLDREYYYLICFHKKVFESLRDFVGTSARELSHDIKTFAGTHNGLSLECFRVWFHANWGANKDKVPALRNQLAYLNSEIIDSEQTDMPNY